MIKFTIIVVAILLDIVSSSTTDPTRTTYDWGKHTSTTNAWSTRTTYDWGKHTSTTTPDPIKTTTDSHHHDHDHDHDHDHNDDDNDHNHYRCGAAKYSCAGTIGLCIELEKICNGIMDCPHGDDENPNICHFHQKPKPKAKIRNAFSGTGFQFQIGQLRIGSRSRVKMFQQDSDNSSSKRFNSSKIISYYRL